MTKVVVVGGGIVGSSAAYRLALAGCSVQLVDREHEGFATAAGAGIISPGTAHTTPDPWYPLAFQAVSFYRELLLALEADGESETGYETTGELLVALNETEVARLTEMRRLILEREQAGVLNIGTVSMLGPAEACRLFPPLHPSAHAIHISGAARVDGRAIRLCMQRALQKHGGVVINDEAHLICQGDAVKEVRVNGTPVAADFVVLAGGAWVRGSLEEIGASVPIYPQRGQILHIDMPGQNTDRWPSITGFPSHYMLAFPGSRVVAGATREDDAGFDYRVTVKGVQQLIRQALEVAPGLAEGTVAEVRVGFRPASPDGIPVLGAVPSVSGLHLASGLGSSGLMMGPFAGAVVADLALGRPAPLNMAPYSPDRFAQSADA